MIDGDRTVDDLLKTAGLSPLDARILLAHVLNVDQAWLLTHGGVTINKPNIRRFSELARRRLTGEPAAYLLGYKEFWGMALEVTPDVLIPRPDTETLVEAALRFLPAGKNVDVLDLGTGSGAVALAIARERPQAKICAVDHSERALAVAERNASRIFGEGQRRVTFIHSNWFSNITFPETFDAIVGNPPYIAVNSVYWQRGELDFEPKMALAAGENGLDDLCVIAATAPSRLKKGGVLLLEHGYDQARAVAELLAENGLTNIESYRDLSGIPRVTGGIKP
ncbi:MAG: peptide chain release factor N(5)-glutamine methyltransferase [Burkholderiales bacterium]|jgi:release factor glutamine methyltransferase|nr:peptide chain release factor N(5)-glutamine methyltransferase [Burkholderiales bacterium]